MSKASEWAAAMESARGKQPAFNKGFEAYAYVTERGQCEVVGTFDQKNAIALARWILDTFGEPSA